MAGRPKKDPTGAALVPITLAVTRTANNVIRAEAAARNMSLVDYLCALVAADTGQQLPGVPPLQEVLELPDTA